MTGRGIAREAQDWVLLMTGAVPGALLGVEIQSCEESGEAARSPSRMVLPANRKTNPAL